MRSDPLLFARAFSGEDFDPAREARLLVSAVFNLPLSELSARMLQGCVVDQHAMHAVDEALLRLHHGEPFAYAVGTAAFRHLTLSVDHRVLIPRPETEIVVEVALRVSNSKSGGIAVDVGTGSGAIALSLATEGSFDRVIATDISLDALEVAQANARRVLEDPALVDFRLGADLAPLSGVRARVLVSNPPYIAYGEAAALPASVRDWEPPVALFAENEGMARYEAILSQAFEVLEPDGYVVLELDSQRAQRTADIALRAGFIQVEIIPDLSGRDRVLVARAAS